MMRGALPFALSALVLGGFFAAACGADDGTVDIPPPPDGGVGAHFDSGASSGSLPDGSISKNDGSVTGGDDDDDVIPGLKSNGASCGAGTECNSGYCTDGVCCDGACAGTCEACNVPNHGGACTAVPDGTDPASECGADPTVDAGAFDASLPKADPNQCAGHCDGNRACAFAPATTTCGATFCGDPTEQGSAQCDGKGHCVVDVTECSAYACPDGSAGCKSACKSNGDCLKPYFCDVPTSTCKPRLDDGAPCTAAGQCASGACTTFYRDIDGDGHGTKKLAAVGATTLACGTTAPAGYSAVSDDCFDSNMAVAKLVHPGQTDYFDTAYTTGGNGGGTPSFDYDCSGTEDKETADEATCGFCNHVLVPLAPPIIINRCAFEATCETTDDEPGHSCGGPIGCTPDNTPAFPSTTKCGETAATITCDVCADADDTSDEIPGDDKTERCH